MPIYEALGYNDEQNPLPWRKHEENDALLVGANGLPVADFETRDIYKGVTASCSINADFTLRAVQAYSKRAGADVRQLQDRIVDWADQNFPNRTTADILLKLYEELGEYARDPKSAPEFGDIMILLLDVARINDIDITKAVNDKMDINEQRKWKVDPNTRIMRHV
jgi:NTP pyrophosphatase (non-canonical NTP hydrolase)